MTGESPAGPEANEPFDLGADEELYEHAYEELKRLAHRQLRVFDANATISTTELVHEAFLKLQQRSGAKWQHRAHFYGAASRAMRQVLVDFARRRLAAKRGGGDTRVSLSNAEASLDIELDDMLNLDAALHQLNAVDQRLRQIVELRFFGGMGEREVAEILGVTSRTVERNWTKARLFLLRELGGGAPSS